MSHAVLAGSSPDIASVVAIADHPDILDRILDVGCVLAVWRRPCPDALAAALVGLEPDGLDDVDAAIPVEDAELHVAAALGAAGYPLGAAVALAGDTAALARVHAGLRGWAAVRLRLDWVETDACRRFHADMLGTRLLATYAGRGTQWRFAGDRDEEAREQTAGDVLMMKGRLLAPDAPVLHRSPPIAAENGRRLLLVVDGPRPSERPTE